MAGKNAPEKQTHGESKREQQHPQGSQSQGGAMTPVHRTHELATSGGFPSLFRLRDEFDRLFDNFFRGWPSMWQPTEPDWRWSLDMEDTDDAVLVRAEAPGFEPGDFDLEVRGDQLVMRASHKAEIPEKEGRRE